MENNQNSSPSHDELDPVRLVEKTFLFIRYYWKPLFLFTFLGLALGIAYYIISPAKYESRLLLQSRVLTNKEQIEIISTWKDLLRKREYASLSKITQTDESILKKLKKIKADEIQKLYIQNNPNGFYVDVLVTDTSVLDEIEKAVLNGLEHSFYVKERVESKKLFFRDMITNLQGELLRLEKTKAAIDSMIRNKSQQSAPLMVDISSLNTQWIGLNEKLLSFREELRFTRAVQVLQHFSPTSKPESPKLLYCLVFGLAGGFFTGYLISIFFFIKQKIQWRTRIKKAPNYESAAHT